MLSDSEVRNKLFALIKLLAAAGAFNAKDSTNPVDAFSNVMSLLMPPSSKDKKSDLSGDIKSSPTPTYDYTYDATTKKTTKNTNETEPQGWTDKFKKMFK